MNETPSQKEGMKADSETLLRITGCQLIVQASAFLNLPVLTAVLAQTIFQRFYMRVSFLQYDLLEGCMASLLIATKSDDTNKPLKANPNPLESIKSSRFILNPNSKEYFFMRTQVVNIEKVMLKQLGFEIYRILITPHVYLPYFVRHMKIKMPSAVVSKAWSFLNDSCQSTVALCYPPHIIACSCLYLAMRSEKEPMPNQFPWWVLMETSIEQIETICGEILYIYTLPKLDLQEVLLLMEDVSSQKTKQLRTFIHEFLKQKADKVQQSENKNSSVDDKLQNYDKVKDVVATTSRHSHHRRSHDDDNRQADKDSKKRHKEHHKKDIEHDKDRGKDKDKEKDKTKIKGASKQRSRSHHKKHRSKHSKSRSQKHSKSRSRKDRKEKKPQKSSRSRSHTHHHEKKERHHKEIEKHHHHHNHKKDHTQSKHSKRESSQLKQHKHQKNRDDSSSEEDIFREEKSASRDKINLQQRDRLKNDSHDGSTKIQKTTQEPPNIQQQANTAQAISNGNSNNVTVQQKGIISNEELAKRKQLLLQARNTHKEDATSQTSASNINIPQMNVNLNVQQQQGLTINFEDRKGMNIEYQKEDWQKSKKELFQMQLQAQGTAGTIGSENISQVVAGTGVGGGMKKGSMPIYRRNAASTSNQFQASVLNKDNFSIPQQNSQIILQDLSEDQKLKEIKQKIKERKLLQKKTSQ